MKSSKLTEDVQNESAFRDWDDIVHLLARSIIVSAALGFALAICLHVAHCPTVSLEASVDQSLAQSRKAGA